MESVRERDSQDIVRGASSPPIFVGFSGQVPPSCPETHVETNNFEGEVVFIKETVTDIGQIQQGQEDTSEGEAEQEEANGEGKT